MFAGKGDSTAALSRLAFRLAVVFLFALAWPRDAAAQAAGMLCLILAAGCFAMAQVLKESPRGPGLNRWHEGAFLVALGLLMYFLLAS